MKKTDPNIATFVLSRSHSFFNIAGSNIANKLSDPSIKSINPTINIVYIFYF